MRKKLATIATKVEIGYQYIWRVADLLDRGKMPSVEASALKMTVTELGRAMAEVSLDIAGPYGLQEVNSKWAAMRGVPFRGYLDCISSTLGAGTSEIQKNIIATRGLGLPRS